jgi:hypothetical protein
MILSNYQCVQIGLGYHPFSCLIVTKGSFFGARQSVVMTTHLHLALSLRTLMTCTFTRLHVFMVQKLFFLLSPRQHQQTHLCIEYAVCFIGG